MDNSSLSPSTLQQICQIFNDLTNPNTDTSIVQQLTSKISEFQTNEPQFHFYLLAILSNDEFSIQEKLLSLIIIYRSYFLIDKSLNSSFIQNSIPILEELLQGKIQEISRLSAAIICSYISRFGKQIIPNFFDHIIQMMQNQEQIEAAFYTLEELSQGSIKIPKEILRILVDYVDADNSYHYIALSIFNNIVEDSINFVHQELIPRILNSYESYELNSLAKLSTISLSTFIHFQDPIIGDFIANCLVINLPPEESSENIIDDQLISTLFDKEDDIQPYRPIISALITKLEKQDDDITNYGICSMSQSILMTLFNKYPEIIGPIVIESISKIENNNGFLIRCLSIIISDSEASEEFIPLIFDEITNNGDSRGEAALCLSRYCEFNCDSNEIIEKSLSLILPLLGEINDLNIRHQSILAIQNIFDAINHSFQPNIEHIEFLANLLKIPQLNSNFVDFTDFIGIYLSFFSSFDEFFEEKNEDSFIRSFFNEIIRFFFSEDETNPLFISFSNILSVFLSKISNISAFGSLLTDILDKILTVLNENDEINDSNIDEKYSCLDLLESILTSYHEFEENKLEKIVNFLIKVIKTQTQSQIIIQKAFDLSLLFYQINPQLMMSEQIVSFFLESCTNYLSTTNQEISYIVSQILILLIPKMNLEQIRMFLKKCVLFLRLYGDRSSPVYSFGHQLYHILVENGQEIDSFIEEFFNCPGSHCSSDDASS